MRPTILAIAMRTASVSYLLLVCPSSLSVGFCASLRTMSIIDSIGRTTIEVTSRLKRMNMPKSSVAMKRVVQIWKTASVCFGSLVTNHARLPWSCSRLKYSKRTSVIDGGQPILGSLTSVPHASHWLPCGTKRCLLSAS